MTNPAGLQAALAPRSIAVIGASDNPHKVGGRPILFMKRYGFQGAIYPVNPAREQVQGIKAYPDLGALPEAPDLVIIAVSGQETVRAVEVCAERGVKVAVVMASGFGEIGGEGQVMQERMRNVAREAGMRLVGPNCQGLANFATGAIANFSTVFHELEAKDGPVAIVSQSGACSQAIYSIAHAQGLAMRHVHATGNEVDVTVADLAREIVEDEGVRLLLLYLEAIPKPELLAEAAEVARARDLPIVAVKSGRTASGQRAASSHTGALASEDRVIDAFFERHAIWRVDDPHALVRTSHLYLKGWRPRRGKLIAVSNSGASCVMIADASEEFSLPLAEFTEDTRARLKGVLPGFATASNPLDVTGALLGNKDQFTRLLPVLAKGTDADLMLAAFPIAGTGYDLPQYAEDFSGFAAASDAAVAVAAPQAEVRAVFTQRGLPVFAREREALQALSQLARHARLLTAAPPQTRSAVFVPPIPAADPRGGMLDEARSLALLAQAGVAVVAHRLCADEDAACAALADLGPRVVMKACSPDLPHKTEHGLVAVGIEGEAAVRAEFHRQREVVRALKAKFGGLIVARMAPKGYELALGARVDPLFGPVVMVGDGGIYLEVLKDFALLLPPFDATAVQQALSGLRIAPLLAGVRGQPACDLPAFSDMVVSLGDAMLTWRTGIESIDLNPVRVYPLGQGAEALDALVELRGTPVQEH